MICENFKYVGLMKYFEEISAIPRGSFNEAGIADYLCRFATSHGLEHIRDEYNNVLIKKSATEGRECEDALMLQGHTDMVCEKNDGVEHDFECEGIKLCVKEGWLSADGTTLGADNGVAVATMLYILDGADGNVTSHPALECLFTVSEEVGLIGAKNFDYSNISATRMINMDSADESQIISGCAGGERITLTYEAETLVAEGEAFKLTVNGLFGGHSGEDINRGRANANKLLGRVLLALSDEFSFCLAAVNGGSKDNAITREASAVLLVKSEDSAKLAACVDKLYAEIAPELSKDDANFALTAERTDAPELCFSKEAGKKIIFLLSTVAYGVFEMNRSIDSLVEYSRNLGVVKTEGNVVSFTFSSRSAMPQRIKASERELFAYADMLGMQADVGEAYPGWDFSEESAIRELYARTFKSLFGRDCEITVIHAGLECGIIKEKLPHMDMISCGPVVLDLHSPDERMELASFERFFDVIKNVVAAC